jgi:hypothetical protein
MARKSPEELEKIKQKYNVNSIYSWSRYHCYKNSKYEYFLKYILKTKEDRKDSIYGISGNMAHEIIQKMYEGKIKYEDMITEYEDALFNFNMAQLKYDRCDEIKNANIAKNYEESLKHFFQNHNLINKKVDIERFVLIKIGKFLFQGYIDFIYKDDSDFIVLDWKTSSVYTGDKIISERGQLLLYAEALIQLDVPIENIKIKWNFLKYVTVLQQQANGNTTERIILRNDIGESLRSSVKMWLNKSKKYTETEINEYLNMVSKTNDIKCLPSDIQLKYEISDCYVEIPFTLKDIDDLKEDIIKTIIEITKKENEYTKTKDENIFWEDVTDKNYYYFANLSGYSAYLNKPYKKYLDDNKGNNYNKNNSKNKNKVNSDDDLDWLSQL